MSDIPKAEFVSGNQWPRHADWNPNRERPAPQIIRTPAELEALDPDALLMTQDGNIFYAAAKGRLFEHDLPAVVVASGERVRACREALEEATGQEDDN